MAIDIYTIGEREQITIGEESTYGTEATPDRFIGKSVRLLNPQNSQGWQEIASAGRDSRTIETFQKGAKSLRFKLSWIVTDWEFLKYTTHGNVSTVNNGDGTYTHTLTVSNNVRSFTLERVLRGNSDNVRRYLGCVFIGQIIIRFRAGEGEGTGWAEAEADVLAQDLIEGASLTSVNFPTKEGFQFRHSKLTIEGNEITEINSGEIRLNNKIDPQDSRYANATLDRKIGQPIPKKARFTIRTNINIKDNTFFNYWNNASALTGTNQIEFIKSSGDKVTFSADSETFIQDTFPDTEYDTPTNADVIASIPKLNISITDDISIY